MKKRNACRYVCLCLLFVCCLLVAPSVGAKNPLVSYGAKAGVNIANNSIDDYDMKVGFVGGVFADYRFSKSVFMRTGLDFSMKGAKFDYYDERLRAEGGSVFNSGQVAFRINYLELPILVGYRYRVSLPTYVYVAGGPYFAYGVYSSGSYKTKRMVDDKFLVVDSDRIRGFDKTGMKRFDMGVQINVGAEYMRYFINLNYEYGFLDIYKKGSNTVPAYADKSKWHNMSASCTLGYRF